MQKPHLVTMKLKPLVINGQSYKIIYDEYGNCPECQNAWIDNHRQLGDPEKPLITYLLEVNYGKDYELDYVEYCPHCRNFWD